ncbi:hypoxanthine phosphoribosyltransferase [bacterium]|nr:hypoxanthine phosphoribosyltransferase [bacterium]
MQIKKQDITPLYTQEIIENTIKEIATQINNDYKDEKIYVVCVLKGAVMFATELVKYLDMPLKMEFVRLSSYGNSRTSSGKVNAVDISLPDLNDENVLIVEDMIDTGLTAKFLTDFINNNFKTKSTKFCSLLDKKSCRKVDIEPDYYGIEVENKFWVGFGLDCEGYYRNLPYIGYVEA